MLSLVQREPARFIGFAAALLTAAIIMWAPLDPSLTAEIVGAFVFLAHELVRSQVSPADKSTASAPPPPAGVS